MDRSNRRRLRCWLVQSAQQLAVGCLAGVAPSPTDPSLRHDAKTMISTYSFRGSIELGAISSDDTGKRLLVYSRVFECLENVIKQPIAGFRIQLFERLSRHESYFLDIEKLKRCLDKREVP
ncbi:uncharacterized protein LOC116018850 [Ipomoea triloba]|uniref:uncharacterized protein LOC116018850 n=1 Tax=Ipomoea triloba TaxID=35885 RepID=UPI00125DEFB2|nr:uncharacterized protein LOC116018850 [Ipomoea triloba]